MTEPSLAEQRERLKAEIDKAEATLLLIGLTNRPVFDAAWRDRKRALAELDRLDWAEKAEQPPEAQDAQA